MNSLKKWICLLVALTLLLGFSACGKDKDESGSEASSAVASEVDSSISASSEEAIPASSVANTPAAAPLSAGKFITADDTRFSAGREPYLQLLDGQNAVFQANTGMGSMATATGTYTFNGSRLVVSITSIDITEAFAGSTLSSLHFNVLGADYLQYSGDAFGLTTKGNLFAREGAPPYDPATAAPAAPAAETPTEASSAPPVASEAESPSAPATDTSGQAAASSSAPTSLSTASPSADITLSPGEEPPSKMEIGDSFAITDVALSSIRYDDKHLEAVVSGDNTSVTFTAIKAGKATLEYQHTDSDEKESYTITIAGDGIPLWVLFAVGGGALVLGGIITFVVLMMLRRGQRGAPAMAGTSIKGRPAEPPMSKKEKSALNKAIKKEKKATQVAKKKEKAAKIAKNKADKAQKEAEKTQSLADKATENVKTLREAAQAKAEEQSKKAAEQADAQDNDKSDTPPDDPGPTAPPGSQVVLE